MLSFAVSPLVARVADFWWVQLVGTLLASGSTLSLAALVATLAMAAYWSLPPRRRHLPRIAVWRRALFPRRMWRSASGRADIVWALFSLFGYGLLFGWLTLGTAPMADAVDAALTRWAGPKPLAALPAIIAVPLLTVVIFLAYEFAYWLDHWLSHKVPALWALHRVHHSADSLSLLTIFRVHPLETIGFAAITAIIVGAVRGVAVHLIGPVSDWQIGGTNALVLGFAVALTHLQHSHLWITFGPRWGKWLLGPAHHQIHHSADPQHHDRNFGSALALFDRLAGTFHMPAARREPLRFGVDMPDAAPHRLAANTVLPVWHAAIAMGRYSAAIVSSARSWAWRFHISAYSPFLRSRAAWVPRSTTSPASSTTISSALTTVDRRWAMTMVVRRSAIASSVDWISASVRLSSALVASSRIRIGGFLSSVRAIATRCFSPPDSFSPRSPTRVS